MNIRPMECRDLEAVLQIAAELPTAPHWPRSAYEDALEADREPRRVALVAEGSSAEIAGFAVAAVLPPEAELETIAVALAQQRRGIGSALLSAISSRCAALGCTAMNLEVRASNESAQRLYRTSGFELCGRRPGYYAFPAEDALVFRCSLGVPEK